MNVLCRSLRSSLLEFYFNGYYNHVSSFYYVPRTFFSSAQYFVSLMTESLNLRIITYIDTIDLSSRDLCDEFRVTYY